MATRIIMPQGGQDITEGLVVRWLRREGDAVRRGEVICEVETEKAVFEVECPIDGVLLKIAVREGERVPIFATIGIVGAPEEEAEIEPLLAAEAAGAANPPAIRTKACLLPHPPRGSKASGRAQRLAAEAGIDLSALAGSGPRGRVTEKDVLAAIETRSPAAAVPPGRALAFSGMREAIARRMVRSKQTIPHFYVTISADMTAALALRDRLNRSEGVAVTITDLIVKASALALKSHPRVNCRIEDRRIVMMDAINIGIAVTLEEEGVVVPVLAGAERLALVDLSRKAAGLIRLGREGRQASTDAAGFTVSNLGMLHVENFIAIINPPEAAILAAGCVEKRPVAAPDGSLAVREMMTMSLSIDHRAVDGALAARFINTVKEGLEHPERLLPPYQN
jgi:pyruvate dehydrogenase E2 component (dihydrolipoamide acetyltransferase)